MPSDFPQVIELRGGLRREVRKGDLSAGLAEVLKGLRPSEDGFYAFEEIKADFSGTSLQIDWPFPQLIREDEITLLCGRNNIFQLSSDETKLTEIEILDPVTELKANLAATGPWSLVAFQELWFLSDGNSFIYKIASSPNAFLSTRIQIEAMVKVGNRVLFGGLTGAHFSSDDWLALFDVWQETVGDRVVTFEGQTFSENWILWTSEAGGGSIRPFLDIIAIFALADFSSKDEALGILRTHIETGNIGFLPVLSEGKVKVIKSLGSDVYVYTTTGLEIFGRETDGRFIHSIHASPGVSSRYAVAGNSTKHIVLDNTGILWTVLLEEKRREGFREFLGQLSAEELISSYDPIEDEAYFGDSERCFVFGPGGLSEQTLLSTGVVRGKEGLLGIVRILQDTFDITLNTDRLGVRGSKLLTYTEIHAFDVQSLQVGLDYENSESNSSELAFIFGSPDGRFYLGVAVDNYKLKLTGIALKSARIEKAIVRFQHADSRTVRGPRGTGVS